MRITTQGAGEGAAQPEGVRPTGGDGEPEVTCEDLGAVQIGLLEFHPGEVSHLDHRVAGAPGVLAAQGALLTVEVLVGGRDVGLGGMGFGHGVLQATLP